MKSKHKESTSDLAELLKPYRSGWVALSSDERRVIAAGATLKETREKVTEENQPNPVFLKLIPPERGYVPPLW